MVSVSAAAASRANRSSSEVGHDDTHFGSLNTVIAECAKSAFVKPFSALMHFLQLSEGGANKKLAEQRAFTGAELARLIQTEEGFQFISAIMATAYPVPRWWRVCAPVMEAADIRKMQITAQKRVAKALSEAIDADQSLTQAIARADALAVHDADHMGPYRDALGAMARVPHRAVAPARKR